MRAGVSRQRIEEDVRRVDRLALGRVLALPAVSPQHPVACSRRELLPPEQLLRGPRDRQLADRMLGAMEGRLGQAPRANGPGRYIGGTGSGGKPIFWRSRSNCGVLIAPGRTSEIATPVPAFCS